MLDRSWSLRRAAARGVLIAVAVALAGSVHGEERGASKAGDTDGHPLHVTLATQLPLKSYIYPYGCTHPQNAEQDGLCIQRRAAQAADESAWWARATFWIGLVGTTLILGTLVATAKAAFAADRSARAALKNAQAVIDAERPHLLKDKLDLLGLVSDPHASPADRRYNVKEPRKLFVDTTFVNQGKTPCRIDRYSCGLVLGELPSVPNYEDSGPITGLWIPQGGDFHVAGFTADEIDVARRTAIMNGKLIIHLVGSVHYESVFGVKHVTRFAYTYRTDLGARWYPAEIPAYWEYT
jgi:hypothetical protein